MGSGTDEPSALGMGTPFLLRDRGLGQKAELAVFAGADLGRAYSVLRVIKCRLAQPVQAHDGTTGYDDVFLSTRRKNHEIPAIDFGSAFRTRWQPVRDCIRRLGGAEGGRCRRNHEMGPDFGAKRS